MRWTESRIHSHFLCFCPHAKHVQICMQTQPWPPLSGVLCALGNLWQPLCLCQCPIRHLRPWAIWVVSVKNSAITLLLLTILIKQSHPQVNEKGRNLVGDNEIMRPQGSNSGFQFNEGLLCFCSVLCLKFDSLPNEDNFKESSLILPYTESLSGHILQSLFLSISGAILSLMSHFQKWARKTDWKNYAEKVSLKTDFLSHVLPPFHPLWPISLLRKQTFCS